eukprot:TRINITY_DN35038_c0_g1_i5.p1 TRINITY_DN35038_c0_g1~~TRINITY_DN35038_c0_g1_i5.p1  ORF type:complete len:587 (+),score=134.65 TRINITY_DN35038_c0_g1_i5:72-1832(+)
MAASLAAELAQLHELHREGALTEQEFTVAKEATIANYKKTLRPPLGANAAAAAAPDAPAPGPAPAPATAPAPAPAPATAPATAAADAAACPPQRVAQKQPAGPRPAPAPEQQQAQTPVTAAEPPAEPEPVPGEPEEVEEAGYDEQQGGLYAPFPPGEDEYVPELPHGGMPEEEEEEAYDPEAADDIDDDSRRRRRSVSSSDSARLMILPPAAESEQPQELDRAAFRKFAHEAGLDAEACNHAMRANPVHVLRLMNNWETEKQYGAAKWGAKFNPSKHFDNMLSKLGGTRKWNPAFAAEGKGGKNTDGLSKKQRKKLQERERLARRAAERSAWQAEKGGQGKGVRGPRYYGGSPPRQRRRLDGDDAGAHLEFPPPTYASGGPGEAADDGALVAAAPAVDSGLAGPPITVVNQGPSDCTLASFCIKLQLDERAERQLRNLNEMQQNWVIATWGREAPRQMQRWGQAFNASQLVVALVMRCIRASEAGPGAAAAALPGPAPGAQGSQPSPEAYRRDVEAYALKHNLDIQAEHALFAADPRIGSQLVYSQPDVLREARNASSLAMSHIKRLSQSLAGKGPRLPPASGRLT